MKNTSNKYTVYKHTFPNNKVYIGITSRKCSDRWGRNGNGYKPKKENTNRIYKAIQKYGWDNIKHEILFTNLSKKEACQKEIELIKQYKSNQREFGYNISTGGECSSKGMHHSLQTRKRIGEFSKLRKGKNHPNYGKIMSDEQKLKISEALKGEKSYWYGKQLPIETRKKLSQSHIGLQRGAKNPHSKCVINIDTKKVFPTLTEAANSVGRSVGAITLCCKGFTRSCGGYHWEYVKEGDNL